MITVYQFNRIEPKQEVKVFSMKYKQWLTAVVTKVLPVPELIKVSYSDKTSELHTRITIQI